MKQTQKIREAQKTLRREQEEHVAWSFPTGTVEHNRDFNETKIIFWSGAKLCLDWPNFEKGEVQCLWLGYPLPTELAEALSEWNFKTLFLSQEKDSDMQDAIHEILTLKDKEFPGQNIYCYAAQKETLLNHSWSEGHTKADDIYAAWLRNARAQIAEKPEGVFIDQEKRESFVKNIPEFSPKKPINRERLKSMWIDPDLIPNQVLATLTKERRTKEKQDS